MDPKAFGPFLKERRTARGLTQAVLAEQLGVTTAAVSKWERGQCLPDIAKFDDLAAILDVSILELFNCELRQDPLPREELTVVFQQTMETTQQQQQRRITRLVFLLTALFLFAGMLYCFPLHRVIQVWGSKTFRTYEISDLFYRGDFTDVLEGKKILLRAKSAAAQTGLTTEEALLQFGVLSRYVYTVDIYPDVVSVESEFVLWSAHFSGSRGTMWVSITQEGRNAAGETVTGHWRIPAYWVLENQNGQWQVSAIHEAP